MPAALKSYVLNLTTEVRRCVNDWESCGSFELNDAMQRLLGALYIAESHTKDQSRWQKISADSREGFEAVTNGSASVAFSWR